MTRLIAASLICGLLAGCAPSYAPEVPASDSGLRRTLGILSGRDPAQPRVLRILFYGQSISTRAWTDMAAAELQRRFPNTDLVVENRAIGGFAADLLERTVARDVTEFYPDLIVFHVYGNHRAYERIIRTMRARTAAEIVVQTDHVTTPVEPVCDEGLHLAWSPPPGCHGHVWFRQNVWEQHMSSVVIPGYARRYGLALEDRRPIWNAYLRRHDLVPNDLLADGLHPNALGWRLMAKLWVTYMQRQVFAYRGERSTLVRSYRVGDADGRPLAIVGNRVELIADAPLDGGVQALVDGHSPTAANGCWQNSRTTSVPGVPEWPMVKQVDTADGVHRADRWTARITAIGPDGKTGTFALSSARGGPDGTGRLEQDFTSPSGAIRIAAKDWVIPMAYEAHGVALSIGFQVQWERRFVCRDQPVVDLQGRRIQTRHVVATGMTNGPHRIVLRLTPEARAHIREIRVYRPPLKEAAA
ncbi:hypothetical protein GCM10011380_28270 [Sphingomonas metalli]|uniref:SGNH/GDSL hydrolase family protein n=1 Tax=Sphingomonas metalli TaxID=1779358 RepID=A0A916T9U3_9SPHN|nr:hypothetical protein [Sphingomonas metalli]GGB37201.1 hypothetical protein GCM10011380_28270 [Sphingomonas metalli]